MTREKLLSNENLSPLAKLLGLWLFDQPRRAYTSGEVGRILGVPGSWVADAGRELSRVQVGLLVKHPEAARIEWSPHAWPTTEIPQPTTTAKGSSPSSRRGSSSRSDPPS